MCWYLERAGDQARMGGDKEYMGNHMGTLLKVMLNPGLHLSNTALPFWGWAGKGAWQGVWWLPYLSHQGHPSLKGIP